MLFAMNMMRFFALYRSFLSWFEHRAKPKLRQIRHATNTPQHSNNSHPTPNSIAHNRLGLFLQWSPIFLAGALWSVLIGTTLGLLLPQNNPPVAVAFYINGQLTPAALAALPTPALREQSRRLAWLQSPAEKTLTPLTKTPRTTSSARHPKKKAPTGPVLVNTASVAQLQTLPGIGPKIAGAIVAHRANHGRFTSVDSLLAVDGIGPKKLAKMKPYLRL